VGLIRRSRENRHSPSHIYLQLPTGSVRDAPEGTFCQESGAKKTRLRERKVPPNNQNQQQNKNNYYQHREDESL